MALPPMSFQFSDQEQATSSATAVSGSKVFNAPSATTDKMMWLALGVLAFIIIFKKK